MPGPDRHELRMRRLGWIGLACTLGVAILSLLNIARLEFGPLAGRAITIDELYFAACAAHGAAVGEIVSTGCHDNKGPLIFLLYKLLQAGASPYSLLAIKAAAFATVMAIAGVAAWIGFRMAGLAAALLAPALIIQVLASESGLLAFKTETVGAGFMLCALALLVARDAPRRPWMLLAAGVCMGLAVTAKQTFGFAAIAVVLWLAVSTPRGEAGAGLPAKVARASLFAFGAGLPLLLFLAVFYALGQHIEFLSSLFLYPSVYGSRSDHARLGRALGTPRIPG